MFTLNENDAAELMRLVTKSGKVNSDKALLEEHKVKLYFPYFDGWEALQTAMVKLDNSTNYYTNEFGDICRVAKLDMKLLDETEKEALRAYLDEKSDGMVFADFRLNCLETSEGDCIIVQLDSGRDNGVYYEHKLILNVDKYEDESELCAAIEHWMETNGVFPTVLRADYYGDVSLFNMQKT